jgi:hypothetical protein
MSQTSDDSAFLLRRFLADLVHQAVPVLVESRHPLRHIHSVQVE